MSLSLVLKAMARLPGFSSKHHACVEGSFFTGSWSLLVALHREQGALAAPVPRLVRECRSRLSYVRSRRGQFREPCMCSPRLFREPFARTLPEERSAWDLLSRERSTSSRRGLAWRFKQPS